MHSSGSVSSPIPFAVFNSQCHPAYSLLEQAYFPLLSSSPITYNSLQRSPLQQLIAAKFQEIWGVHLPVRLL